jgi:integrase
MSKNHLESEYVPTYFPGIDVCSETTIAELAQAYLEYAKPCSDSRDYSHFKVALDFVCRLFSKTKTNKFGTKSLIEVRELFVKQGYSRKYCNRLTTCVRKVFKWGSVNELVPISIPFMLTLVPPLLEGQTTAPEREPRQDVPDEVVERTLPYLLPTVAAMVRVQRAAVMRPSEACNMKVGDIDMRNNIWLYRPGKHKGKWRGHHRTIALGKQEQEIIAPRLIGKQPENAVFSPKDAISERWKIASAKRKTKRTPSQEERHKKAVENNRSRVREHYDAGTYGRSITKSIKKANKTLTKPIPHWTPYQLRHAGVTEITETDGLDTARAVAGQKTIAVTQIYNHADTKIAIRNAKKRSVKKIPKKSIKLKQKKKQKPKPQKPPIILNAFVGSAEEFYEYELNRAKSAEIALQTSSGFILTLYKEGERRNG